MREAGPQSASPGLGSLRWNAAALGLFAAALAVVLGRVWSEGPRQVVPVSVRSELMRPVVYSDVSFEAWLVARHARTLVRAPWRLFETEHCAPGERTLTLGLPMITMGLLAVPAGLARDPILVYNLALLALLLASAVSMYLLATDWTGVPAAGICAGLLFAFHPLRLDNIYHPTELDIGWTALALFFARRLLATARWRDAVGLALAGSLQLAASFYPTLAAALLAIPIGFWLLRSYGLRRAGVARLAFVAAGIALAAAVVFGPYLAERGAAPGHLARGVYFFAPWPDYLPGRELFPGWALLGLAALGLALPRRLAFPGLARDPRLALCAGALLVALVAGGPLVDTVLSPFGVGLDAPAPYEILASLLPGLSAVRVIERLSAGVVLVLALLAAAGVAGAARLSRRRAGAVGAALAGLSALSVAAPSFARAGPAPRLVAERIRPRQEILDFFATLEAKGNRGAILELPYEAEVFQALWAPQRILASAWHRRRTSACFGSYFLPERERVAALAAALPGAEAVRELAALGFTTVVVHDPKGAFGAAEALRLEAGTGRVRLQPLLATDVAAAWEIRRRAPAGEGGWPAHERAGRGA
jgi:hypothetical protein